MTLTRAQRIEAYTYALFCAIADEDFRYETAIQDWCAKYKKRVYLTDFLELDEVCELCGRSWVNWGRTHTVGMLVTALEKCIIAPS